MKMYSFELSERFLSLEEQNVFDAFLKSKGLDKFIWPVFSSLFKSKVKNGVPLVLRIYENKELCGAILLVRCYKYGKALFENSILSGLINWLNISYLQWINFGCCMDMMSNEGFFRNPRKSEEIVKSVLIHLKENHLLTIVTDYSEHAGLYQKASILPALPHAVINCTEMRAIRDYTKNFKNINRKIRVFESKGGKYVLQEKMLSKEQLNDLRKCFISTSEKSVFYLPYQDLYLNAALTTSSMPLDNAYYFIATLNDKFIGYQAAIKTGKYLNALHGAFDRDLKSNHHAYDILFVKMTAFAIENKLEICDFGAVLNFTKQRMVNTTSEMSYFVLSKYSLVQWVFKLFLKTTRVQAKKQLKFRS